MSRFPSRSARCAIAASLVTLTLAGVPAAHAASRPARRATPTAASVHPTPATHVAAASDSAHEDLTLKGGQEGTVFKSLTVEGEDRIHVEIERPELELDLDPQKAPGLDWGSARDVLDRTTPDLVSPLVALSAQERTPYLGRPWLSEFASGTVARFRPAVEGVQRWKLMVVDARGQTVASFAGTGNPPREIPWDGRSQDGSPVSPGLTYSYVFEAIDRAGNKRNFVGQGFAVSAYRLETPQGSALLFSARELAETGTGGASPSGTAPIVLEAASWLNQSESPSRSIQLTARARTYEQASRLANGVAHSLAPLLLGDPARLKVLAVAQPDAPEEGTLTLRPTP